MRNAFIAYRRRYCSNANYKSLLSQIPYLTIHQLFLLTVGPASRQFRRLTRLPVWHFTGLLNVQLSWLSFSSAVFNDFAALCKIFLVAPGSIFYIFWLRIVHFGLVCLWHMIRQFRIHLNLQTFCVHSWPLARSAAHPQLRVLGGP